MFLPLHRHEEDRGQPEIPVVVRRKHRESDDWSICERERALLATAAPTTSLLLLVLFLLAFVADTAPLPCTFYLFSGTLVLSVAVLVLGEGGIANEHER